jgi:hypothetical protein
LRGVAADYRGKFQSIQPVPFATAAGKVHWHKSIGLEKLIGATACAKDSFL